MKPVAETPPSTVPPDDLKGQPLVPIWARDSTVTRVTGLGRTKLWTLAKEGKIRSCSLKEPGMKQATRLFHVPSILEYIESFEEKGGEE